MNYRHGFHAGGAADCLKHALLVALLDAMQRKPGGIAVLDTHAGTGATPLDGSEAARTGEWRQGIGRLAAADPADSDLRRYLDLARRLGLTDGARPRYPGSPALVAAMLRPQDRLDACELHPAEAARLRDTLAAGGACASGSTAVHARDGYAAIGALLPPPTGQRRALVLVDPPFEAAGEFEAIEAAIGRARARLRDAVVACWYPIKHRAPVRAFHDRLRDSGARDLVAFELHGRAPLDPSRLNGSGVLVASPPWGFEGRGAALLDALLPPLRDPDAEGAAAVVSRLADE